MRPRPSLTIAFAAFMAASALQAHHPSGTEPSTADVVIARVYTTDRDRIRQLGRQHDLWGYVWREAYAVIRTDRERLPPDARIDEEATAGLQPAIEPWRGTGTIPARPCYRTVEQTFDDLEALATANPGLAHWVDFGDSWEKVEGLGGYDLRSLVLSNQAIAGPKPVFMLIAASHARELATAETAARFAEMLVAGYDEDPDITWMLDYFEVHVIAHHNPDGRKMAEAECSVDCTPSWRKNTNQGYCGPESPQRGADLNRNADNSFWGGPSSSGSECNDTYRGASAASEPETGDIEAYAATSFPDFRDAPPDDFLTPADSNADGIFISVHSFSEIVFYPWEGIEQGPPNLAGLRALAQKMGFSTTYAACQNCFLGPASGTNVDQVYEKLGVPSFTYEIGTSFGQTCETFENTVLPQTLAGLFNALRHSRRSYQTPLGPDVYDVVFQPGTDGGTLMATADDTQRAVNGGGEPVDAAQLISQVRYTIDQPPWLAGQSFAMQAGDGAFDENQEQATAVMGGNQIGSARLVFVYAEDADGNQGPPAAAWLIGDDFFGDGFEAP